MRAQKLQKSFKNPSFLRFSSRSRSEKERGFRPVSGVRVWVVRWTVWRGWKGLWRRVCAPCVQRTLTLAAGLRARPGEDPWQPCRRAVWWTPSSPLGREADATLASAIPFAILGFAQGWASRRLALIASPAAPVRPAPLSGSNAGAGRRGLGTIGS